MKLIIPTPKQVTAINQWREMNIQYAKLIAPAILTLSFAFAANAQTAGGNASDRQSPQSKESSRPDYRKGVIELHLGRASVGGDLKSVFSNGIYGGVNIGYRFQRYLQADGGFDFSRGAAGVNRSIDTTGGVRSVGDTEYFTFLGGRLVLPIANERALLSAGGGFAYLKYSEVGRAANANEEIVCSSCVSRSGRGAYEMVQVQFLVDSQRRFGVGLTAKFFQAKTKGAGLGTALQQSSNDRWGILSGTFSVHF